MLCFSSSFGGGGEGVKCSSGFIIIKPGRGGCCSKGCIRGRTWLDGVAVLLLEVVRLLVKSWLLVKLSLVPQLEEFSEGSSCFFHLVLLKIKKIFCMI